MAFFAISTIAVAFDMVTTFEREDGAGSKIEIAAGMHWIASPEGRFPKRLAMLASAADRVAFETAFDPAGLEKARTTMESLSTLETGASLSELLSPKVVRLLGKEQESAMARKPWFVALAIRQRRLGGLAANGAPLNLESWLAAAVRKSGGEIAFLEAPGKIGSLFNSLTPDEQESFLLDTLRLNPRWEAQVLERMRKSWEAGDGPEFEKHTLALVEKYPEAMIKVARTREAGWVEILRRWAAQDEETLVVVGAAHLVGPGNLLERLEQSPEFVRIPGDSVR